MKIESLKEGINLVVLYSIKMHLTMKFIPFVITFCLIFINQTNSFAQKYKEMMYDPAYNFYDVVKEGEKYFKDKDKGKGSGWKGFQRWIANNEYKYYPSGDRSSIDPFFVKNQFLSFIQNNPVQKDLFNNGWEGLGPNTIDQISGQYSVGLGRVETFYVHPSNAQIIYLGSRSGGFWSSSDGGATWQGGTTDFLTASGVNTIAVSPTNSDSILINVRNSSNRTTHGIFRSTDGGNTWSISDFNPSNIGWGGLGTNKEIYTIKYHPTIPNLVFIGTKEGLYRSDDNLSSWTVPVSAYDFTDIAFHPTDPMIVYATAKDVANRLYVSTDGGVSFTYTTLAGNSGARIKLSVSTDCEDCIYAASGSGVYKSTDNGGNFSLISVPPTSADGFFVNDLDTSKMLIGALDAFISVNGGANFNQVTYWSLGNTNAAGGDFNTSYQNSTDYIHADLRGAASINGVYYVCTDGFLVKSSDNGYNWDILSEGTSIRENYNLGVSQSNHYRTICGSQDNGTSIKVENNWIEFYGADGMEALIHPLNDDWMMGSYQYGGRLRTKDGGLNNNVVTPPNQNGYWIAPMFYDPNDQMSVYSIGEKVYKSEDFGSTWSELGTPLFSGEIKYATIAENNSNIIVVARNQYIYKSIDGGMTFFNIKNNLPSNSITDVVFDPKNDSVIVVTYGHYQNSSNKVFITTNGGDTWSNITYNLNYLPCLSVAIDHTDSSNIYIGSEIGVYTKTMNGTTWELYNPDLPNVAVKELDIMWGTNTLRAASWGRGLLEYSLVGRKSYPAILKTDITDEVTEDTPKEDVEQYVTAEIQYDNTLTSVFVKWSADNPTFDNTIGMHEVSPGSWMSWSPLPSYTVGTKMYFKVYAVGSAGDTTETYKFQYTVRYNPNAGVEDLKESALYTIHPNPTQDIVLLEGNHLLNAEIVVRNNSGKICKVSISEKSSNSMKLDFQDLPAGIYFINVSLENELKEVIKCVVQ